ncbi:hypothetical protein JCM13304A_17270 [Desulfothermus okinawensis JCM 13304]
MYKLILFFIVGIIFGVFLKKHNALIRICQRLCELSVFLLLFILGFLMGSNPSIMKNLFSMGYDALIISVFSIIGSILLILPIERKIK